MKNAFTMIELIFVIVILGILAAVAVPKLVTTRDDAEVSLLIANTRICINDVISEYKGRNIVPDLTTIVSCVAANSGGATITINGDFVNVVDSGLTDLDGDHRMKGQAVTY